MKVLYTSAAYDSSGYAEAARNYICALAQQPGIDLSLQLVSFENWTTQIGQHYDEVMKPLVNKPMDPDVQIIHLTPENFPRYHRPGIKNIGYTVWETSELPEAWVPMLNAMDEIWVPCDWNVEVFKNSGVTVPVLKVPHTFHEKNFQKVDLPDKFNIPDDAFVFYSVFQWNARKNPEDLLRAYYHEFSKSDNVCLVLKTYAYNHSPEDLQFIKQRIMKLKQSMWLPDTAPIVLIHESLSREEMAALHTRGDAFVLTHRAEGWGIPHFESMAAGNVTIATNFSGNLEFMNQDNSLLVNHTMTPCYGMDRGTYHGRMAWAQPDVVDFGKKMRQAYDGFTPAEKPELVLKKFSWDTVGTQIVNKLRG
jgi:glycosyltransferase involved in cell wall biosynthesis